MSDPVQRVLDRGAARVTKINVTTRDAIQSAIATAIAQDVSLLDLADAIEQGGGDIAIPGLDAVYTDYRAEMIARTELMDAYNAATLGSYADAGFGYVQAIDGYGDEECAARNGQTFSMDEADTIEDHSNGTLDWIPVMA